MPSPSVRTRKAAVGVGSILGGLLLGAVALIADNALVAAYSRVLVGLGLGVLIQLAEAPHD